MQESFEITTQQLKELACSRRVIYREIVRIKTLLSKQETVDALTDLKKMRDGAVTDLLRISQAHLRIIAQEQDLLRKQEVHKTPSAIPKQQELSAEDWLVIEAMVKKRHKQMAAQS
jgi:hypothetical protein